MSEIIYDLAMEQSHRVGTLLGTIGAILKYDILSKGVDDYTFRQLAKAYIECSTNQFDIDMVMEQAQKRGVDIT